MWTNASSICWNNRQLSSSDSPSSTLWECSYLDKAFGAVKINKPPSVSVAQRIPFSQYKIRIRRKKREVKHTIWIYSVLATNGVLGRSLTNSIWSIEGFFAKRFPNGSPPLFLLDSDESLPFSLELALPPKWILGKEECAPWPDPPMVSSRSFKSMLNRPLKLEMSESLAEPDAIECGTEVMPSAESDPFVVSVSEADLDDAAVDIGSEVSTQVV